MTVIQFPAEFKWGAATAAYQIEGAYNEGGRGLSIWDVFSKTPGHIINNDHGDVACDSYHRYKEDVKLLAELGVDTYRFSISWPRIFPDGTGKINEEGLAYYHRLVDELLSVGIEPFCTLYHWDLPQALQERGGWANRETIEAFEVYAAAIFKSFKGKIKQWVTINEPWCVAFQSHYAGVHAPGLKDLQLAVTVSHHLLIAHGKAVQKLREICKDSKIGFAPNVGWHTPYSTAPEDIKACDRNIAWLLEWFIDPVLKGSYPQFLVDWYKTVHHVEPPIRKGDMEVISEPIDFLGINYYSGSIGRYKENSGLFGMEKIDMDEKKTDIGWTVFPEGFYQVLVHIKENYGQIPIYITENGACDNTELVEGKVNDKQRIDYLRTHIASLHRALKSGVNLKGYYLWSLMDNFEWAKGYSMRFGLVHVNFETLERTKKESYYWYQNLVKENGFEL